MCCNTNSIHNYAVCVAVCCLVCCTMLPHAAVATLQKQPHLSFCICIFFDNHRHVGTQKLNQKERKSEAFGHRGVKEADDCTRAETIFKSTVPTKVMQTNFKKQVEFSRDAIYVCVCACVGVSVFAGVGACVGRVCGGWCVDVSRDEIHVHRQNIYRAVACHRFAHGPKHRLTSHTPLHSPRGGKRAGERDH